MITAILTESLLPMIDHHETVIEMIDVGPLQEDGDFNGEDMETQLYQKMELHYKGKTRILMHLKFIEVDEQGIATNPELREDVRLVAELCACCPGELTTIEIDGRRYVPVAFPFTTL